MPTFLEIASLFRRRVKEDQKVDPELTTAHYVAAARTHWYYMNQAVEKIMAKPDLLLQLQQTPIPGFERTTDEIRARVAALQALKAINEIR